MKHTNKINYYDFISLYIYTSYFYLLDFLKGKLRSSTTNMTRPIMEQEWVKNIPRRGSHYCWYFFYHRLSEQTSSNGSKESPPRFVAVPGNRHAEPLVNIETHYSLSFQQHIRKRNVFINLMSKWHEFEYQWDYQTISSNDLTIIVDYHA